MRGKKIVKFLVVDFFQKDNENVLEMFSVNDLSTIKSLTDLLYWSLTLKQFTTFQKLFLPKKKFVDFFQKHNENVVNCFGVSDQCKRSNKCDFIVDWSLKENISKTFSLCFWKNSTTSLRNVDNFSEKVDKRRKSYRIHLHQVDKEIKWMWFYVLLMIKRKHFYNILIVFLKNVDNFFRKKISQFVFSENVDNFILKCWKPSTTFLFSSSSSWHRD